MRALALWILLFITPAVARDYVIFDTDSGVFGDDGAALVMLVRSPKDVTLAGITVVPGNVWGKQGAEYMYHILGLLHRPNDVVYLGAAGPLVNSPAMASEFNRRWGHLEYSGAFTADAKKVKAAPDAKLTGRAPSHIPAVQFIINEVERRPGDVTIVAVGPLTNVALFLSLRPDLAPKVRQIVIMGGNFRVPGNATPAAEFNFWFDPEAARIVLRSRIKKKVLFALDACNHAPIRKAQFDAIAAAKTPITDLFAVDLGNRYPGFYKNPNATTYLWDSLAAGWLIDSSFVTATQPLYLDVETTFGKFYGATVPLDRNLAPQATPVTFVLSLDFKRVWELFRRLMTVR